MASMTISRDHFPPEGNITPNLVRTLFGNRLRNHNDDNSVEVKKCIDEVDRIRHDVREYARVNLKNKMVECVRAWKPEINTWSQLLNLWKNDGSEETAAIIFSACFGIFENGNECWMNDLETEYMTMKKMAYYDIGNGKGCIARVFSHMKNYLVKSVNAVTKTTHGQKVTVSRSSDEITDENRFLKRKKGKVFVPFVRDSQNKAKTSHLVKEVLDGKPKVVSDSSCLYYEY